MSRTLSTLSRHQQTRRQFLTMLGGAAAAVGGSGLLASCSSGSASGSSGSLTLSSWDNPADIESYTKMASKYRAGHPGVHVRVEDTPGGDFDAWISARLAAHKAPSILRWPYQDIGKYAKEGGFVDLSKYLPSSYGDAFQSAYWASVNQNGGVYGIPQHTDGWGIYVNQKLADKIGASIPSTPDSAWSWDEFMQIAREMKKATGKYAFSYFFSGPGTGWRWLPVLYMHGGSLLNSELTAPTIDSPEGVEAIAWAQKWYSEGLVSPSNSIKGSQSDTASNLFTQQQVGMMISSDFNMNSLKGQMPEEEWTVTYLFKDVKAATNMGGNALVVTSSAEDPQAAEKFVEFLCDDANMKYFCEQGLFVPVRQDLIGQQLQWGYRPELMKRLSQQAGTLSPEMAKLQTLPAFGTISQALSDQLDVCFSGQQSPTEAAKNISDAAKAALAS